MRLGFQRSSNFTAERPDMYQPAKAVALLESLPAWVVNASALAPYGFTPRGRAEVQSPISDLELFAGAAAADPAEQAFQGDSGGGVGGGAEAKLGHAVEMEPLHELHRR